MSPKNPVNYFDWWFITIPNARQEFFETSLDWSHPIRNTLEGLYAPVRDGFSPFASLGTPSWIFNMPWHEWIFKKVSSVLIFFFPSSGPVCLNWTGFIYSLNFLCLCRYHEMDVQKTLRDNLSCKTLIEYPVLHVVLRDHWKEYPLKGPGKSPPPHTHTHYIYYHHYIYKEKLNFGLSP